MFPDALSSVVGVFARKFLNPLAVIKESEEVMDASKVFMEAIGGIKYRRKIDKWAVPAGFVRVQTFPVHITHFLAKLYKDGRLYERCRHIPLSQ